MDRAKRTSELAALLDGEIKDHELAEALHNWVDRDQSFQDEFAAQREVKTLLSRLPEYEAPPYLATRVLGAISARKRKSTSVFWRTWATAIGGFILCLSATGAWQMLQPIGTAPMIARTEGNSSYRVQTGVSMNPNDLYIPAVWENETVSFSGQPAFGYNQELDPRLADFLEFASDAHNYARAMYAADLVSPDLPAAVLVLDRQGGVD